jgi:N-ethylmaleimide reductase
MIHLRLLEPFRLGDLTLSNRVVMAPMARARADALTGVPGVMLREYYVQRATAGLIITEALPVCARGMNIHRCSCLFSEEQIREWRAVTDAVHDAGGRIFAQLLHAGRASHVLNQLDGGSPVAPSVTTCGTRTLTRNGFEPMSAPRELTIEEIPAIVGSFAKAAKAATRAGFDGVEIHAANGYLIDQFMKSSTNHRTDNYGGSITNRLRFMLEVTDAVCAVNQRVGIRIAPGTAQDAWDGDPQALFSAAVAALNERSLIYLHVIEGTASGSRTAEGVNYDDLHSRYGGVWVANNGYDAESGEAALRAERADLISFGRPFISNPDLVARIAAGAPFAPSDKSTYFMGEERGLTDYPTMEQVAVPGA